MTFDWLVQQAMHYGYLLVFAGVMLESFGIPLPGETSLFIGAALAGSGRLNLLLVGLVAWSAAVIGPSAGYGVGLRYGRRLLGLRWVQRVYSPERLGVAEDLFARRGWLAVLLGRFVAILRIFAGPLAGLHRMPWWQFFVSNAVGSAAWVFAVCAVGALVGKNLQGGNNLLVGIGYAALGVGLLAGGSFLLVRSWRKRSSARSSSADSD